MIKLISGSLEDGSIVHFINCSEKECKHNVSGACSFIAPKLIKERHNNPFFNMMDDPEIICYSCEQKTKEEPKMSDVKITYKPVDKKAKAKKAIDHGLNLGMLTANIADKIDAIYNGKEEDGDINELKIELGPITVQIHGPKYKPETVRISVEDVTTNTGHVDYITKQQAYDLGVALMKMSEQI